jgi:hypothetical protein
VKGEVSPSKSGIFHAQDRSCYNNNNNRDGKRTAHKPAQTSLLTSGVLRVNGGRGGVEKGAHKGCGSNAVTRWFVGSPGVKRGVDG